MDSLRNIGTVVGANAGAIGLSMADVNSWLQAGSLIAAITYTLIRIHKETNDRDEKQ